MLLRERWQMELLYKLWKQQAQVDEWHTRDRWRMVCELYAKLLGVTLQHWLMVMFVGTIRNVAWSNWHRWCAIPVGASWRPWLAFAPCARPCG